VACSVDVGSGKLGKVVVMLVVMIAVAEGIELELAVEFAAAVKLDAVDSANIPIIGGSLPSIP